MLIEPHLPKCWRTICLTLSTFNFDRPYSPKENLLRFEKPYARGLPLNFSYEEGMFPEVVRRHLGENPFEEAFVQEATAIHEAGHAVAALLCGRPYKTGEIHTRTAAGMGT